MRHTTQTWLVIGFLALALSVAGCGEKGGDKGGGGSGGIDGADSPEALVEMARPFADSSDMGALMGFIAPQDRPVMAFMGIFMARMMPQMMQMGVEMAPDEEAKKAAEAKLQGMKSGIGAVLAKHGVDLKKLEGPEVQGLMQGGGDPDSTKVRAFMQSNFPDLKPGAFMSAISAVMQEFGDEEQTEMMSKGFKGKLENLKVDGDRATGTVDGEDTVFVRVNGRWYLLISEMNKE